MSHDLHSGNDRVEFRPVSAFILAQKARSFASAQADMA
jgi:hypothetical protein